MHKKLRPWVVLVLLTIFVGGGWAAETISATCRLLNLPPIVLTTNGDASTSLGVDTANSAVKKSFVRTITILGVARPVLVRLHQAKGHMWVDVVGAASIGELTTRVNAMDLSATAVGHPAPTHDLIDDSAIAAAGG